MYNLPLWLTILRMLLTPVFAYLFWLDGPWCLPLAIVVFSIAALTDMFDGLLARRHGMVSEWGTFLDPIADKILIGTTLVCFVLKGLLAWWLVALIFGRDLMVTLLRICALKNGFTLPTTYVAKAKTVAQFIVIYVIFMWGLVCVYGAAPTVIDRGGFWVSLIVYIVVAFTAYTGLDYLIAYYRLRTQQLVNRNQGKL